MTPRRGGDLYVRTLLAYREWCSWRTNHDAAARLGGSPPSCAGEGAMCKAYFDASVYTRRGTKDPYMAGITLCRRCHCPHVIEEAPPPVEKEIERERELARVGGDPADDRIREKEH